ncbi:cyclic nucleotide binding protein [Sesbania bispinosa]|nr:cyclic nucleotide binding protein [Sesbania bispinosa]
MGKYSEPAEVEEVLCKAVEMVGVVSEQREEVAVEMVGVVSEEDVGMAAAVDYNKEKVVVGRIYERVLVVNLVTEE